MKPAPFAYRRVSTVTEALGELADLGDDAKVLAGGQSLVAMMNLRLAKPSALVDINPVPGLAFMRESDDRLHIGALTRHSQIESYPLDLGPWSVLQRTCRWVGHYPIRRRGSFGGSIAHADPSAEWCILAQLLDAEVVARSTHRQRVIAAQDFFLGFLTTALDPEEMVVSVQIPRPPSCAALTEFARRHGDFAIVAAAVACDVEDGLLRDVRLCLGGVADRPVRLPTVEAAADGQPATSPTIREIGAAAAKEIDPPTDNHATAAYRRFVTAGLIERAFDEAFTTSATPIRRNRH